jgi:hypothetical protein
VNYLIRNATAIHTQDTPGARDIRIRNGCITEMGRGW